MFDGNRDNVASDLISAVFLNGAGTLKKATFSNNVVVRCSDMGVKVDGAEGREVYDVLILNNRIERCRVGIGVGEYVYRCIVHGNIVANSEGTASMSACPGIDVESAFDCVVSNNIVYGSKNYDADHPLGHGIDIGPYSEKITVIGNVVLENEGIGIQVHAYDKYIQVVGNLVRDSGREGIKAMSDKTQITGNYLINNPISLYPASYCKISNNYIIGGGITLRYSGETYSTNNEVSNNYILSAPGTGIYLEENCNKNVIKGNIIIDAAGPGIYLYEYAHYSQVVANIVKDCDGEGIIVRLSNYVLVADNYCEGNSGTGIDSISAHYALVLNNYVIENGKYGIRVYNSDYGVYRNNFVKDNSQAEANTYYGFGITSNANYNLVELNRIENPAGTQNWGLRVATSDCEGNRLIENYVTGHGATNIGDEGTNTILKRNVGYATEKSGIATFSGDGSTTDLEIGAHGLVITDPSKIAVKITPASSDAIAASPCVGYVDPADNTKIRVKFSSAPASGSENVKIVWYAEVIS